MSTSIVEKGMAISAAGTAAYYGLNWMMTEAAQVFAMVASMIEVPS